MDASLLRDEVHELAVRLANAYFDSPTRSDMLMVENIVLHGVLLGMEREMASMSSVQMARPIPRVSEDDA